MSKPFISQIEFVKRHLITKVSTFNARSAIYRLDALLFDLAEVKPLLEPVLEERLAPAFFEFVSYYKVGFATCLEWHAKSRLYDLFVFDPKTIEKDDINRAVSENKLPTMISEGVTVPHLLAAATGISTMETYVNTMGRVLKALGAKTTISQILAQADEGVTDGQLLNQLFDERNSLVHEISLMDIGHRNIRISTSFEDALATGNRVMRIIRAIEAQITECAPEEFPNRLTADGYEVDEEETLRHRIKKIEQKIESALSSFDSSDTITIEKWQEMRIGSEKYISAELDFINRLNLAGAQYFDVRPFMKENLLKQRLQYLEFIANEVVGVDA
ncbi:hypothetical protein [Rhizobium tubonense]|uniref:Uncharacterized protein n=1 Tax=Rhizobium tubonense TaxID=484088 RepID=A0A2W4CS66_9HYPH|nr:hypothetical protein [Rhizobium tubonense]PZM08254.1 hypothetical protein CPY51_29445 [Rhizobium tubonense]